MSKLNCVSYSRAVAKNVEVPPIPEQRQIITDFLKSKKLFVSKRYTDRKLDAEEDENFFAMKTDGISRKYDCVAFVSLDYFGKNFLSGHSLLSKLFLPAGLHFICVSDSFCSFEHGKEEIEEYLKKKRTEYLAKRCAGMREARNKLHPFRKTNEGIPQELPQRKQRARYNNILSPFIYEKETGNKLITRPFAAFPAPIYAFYDIAKENNKQRTVFITVEEMVGKVIERIEAEKETAQRIATFLPSEAGQEYRERMLAQYHIRAKELLDQLVKKLRKIPVSEDSEDSEDSQRKIKQIEKLDEQYLELAEQFENATWFYSKDNAWLSLYASFDRSSFTCRKAVGQFLDKIVCDNFGNTEIYLKEQESKAAFQTELENSEEMNHAKEESENADT